jgi:hypothetical protein
VHAVQVQQEIIESVILADLHLAQVYILPVGHILRGEGTFQQIHAQGITPVGAVL